jgi:WD40 repeat protein
MWCPGRWARRGTGLVVACLLSVGAGAWSAAEPKPGADLYGDALPPGALARLGTVRWRTGSTVNYVAFTADGKALLTASQDNTLRLWDVSTGKEIRRFGGPRPASRAAADDLANLLAAQVVVPGGTNSVSRPGSLIALAPDGKTLAAGTQGNSIQFWDVATGGAGRRLPGPPGRVSEIMFSPDGKTLAVRGGDQTISLWDVTTGEKARQIKAPQVAQPGNVIAVVNAPFNPASANMAFSPDGKLLAAMEPQVVDRRVVTGVRVLETDTGKQIGQFKVEPQGNLSSLAFAPDGKALVYANGNAIHFCEPASGKEIRRIDDLGNGLPVPLFSPDGKMLLVRHVGNPGIGLCDLETGKVVRWLGEPPPAGSQGFFRGRAGSGTDVAFSPDGTLLATGGTTVRLWETATGKEIVRVQGHGGTVNALVIAPGGDFIASRGTDGTVCLWDPATGKQRHEFRTPAGTTAIGFAPDGRTIALGNADTTIRLCDTATGRELRKLKGHVNGVAIVAFSPDGKTLASRGRLDNTIRLHDVATGAELRQIAIQLKNNAFPAGQAVVVRARTATRSPSGLLFSPDGKQVASVVTGLSSARGAPSGAAAGTLTLWDVTTGKEVRRIELPADTGITGFAFAPDGRTAATANTDGTVTLWEVASGKERGRLGKSAGARAAPPAPLVAFAGGPPAAPATPASLTIAFAPDGRTLTARGPDQSLRVWDVITGKELGQLKGHQAGVTALALAPDGKTLASGSSDTTILVWDLTRFPPEADTRTAELQPQDAQALWHDLGGDDAAKAFRAIHALAGARAQAVAFLGAHLRPVERVDPRKIDGWIADLDSTKFTARSQAAQELEKLGDLAVPALTRALGAEMSLETRRRVEQLLEKLTGVTLTPDQVRLTRALEVLERVGTPEARQVLETLRAGAPGALATREAEATLARLDGRRPAQP